MTTNIDNERKGVEATPSRKQQITVFKHQLFSSNNKFRQNVIKIINTAQEHRLEIAVKLLYFFNKSIRNFIFKVEFRELRRDDDEY